VIMLFRLRMSADEAIRAYVTLAEHVFSSPKWGFQTRNGKFKATRLEDAIATVIQKALNMDEEESRSVRMLDEKAAKWYGLVHCYTPLLLIHLSFVCAMPAGNFSFPTLFRSWIPGANPAYNCTIVDAARATSAAPAFFKAIEFGDPIKHVYVDGGLGCNNPVKYVIEESKSLFFNRPISCVISLGTGAADVIRLDQHDAFQWLLPTNMIRALKGIATDCEMRSEETARDAETHSFLYCRLNVDQGLQGVSLAEWEKLTDVQVHTLQYLMKHDVGQKVDQLVQTLEGVLNS